MRYTTLVESSRNYKAPYPGGGARTGRLEGVHSRVGRFGPRSSDSRQVPALAARPLDARLKSHRGVKERPARSADARSE